MSQASFPLKQITAQDLKPRLTEGREIALLDVREAGQYGEGHPFFAIPLPYSRLELLAPKLLPRHTVPVVLFDDGDGVAQLAARRLEGLGYRDVSILEGGAPGWQDAGFTLFKGVNVPSKAFGELVEHAADTPTISAQDLHDLQVRGQNFLLVDGRTAAEFQRMNIPGARHCPNAELGHRLGEMVADEETLVVVNCAGRTRSIIGTEGLRAQGYSNPIKALENGTQGWQLAGFELESGSPRQFPADLSPETLHASRQRAATFIEGAQIPVVDQETCEAWRKDPERSLYLLDVRTREEFEAGHIDGARHAPGGQLVQATDQWIAVRGARILLCDDTNLRAANTAYWLRQMGHDAYVFGEDVTHCANLKPGPELETDVTRTLPTAEGELGILLDLNPSPAFRSGHIDGARWAIRSRLKQLELPPEAQVTLCALDPRMAELAAIDLRELGIERIAYLPGDAQTWRNEGREIVATPAEPDDATSIDYLFFVHDRHSGNLDAARGYLAWEIALPDQLDAQERGSFRLAGA